MAIVRVADEVEKCVARTSVTNLENVDHGADRQSVIGSLASPGIMVGEERANYGGGDDFTLRHDNRVFC